MPTDSSAAAVDNMILNLEKNSGASFATWLERARAAGSDKHGEIVTYLKTTHRLGHGYANLVAHKLKEAAAGGPASDDALIEAQYAGPKVGLRPILEAILVAIGTFGSDVEIAPKKTCVSLRRAKQFALVQTGGAKRVDLGLVLKDTPAEGRLEAAGSFNAMVTHRVRISAPTEVDASVVGWLRTAYDQAAPKGK